MQTILWNIHPDGMWITVVKRRQTPTYQVHNPFMNLKYVDNSVDSVYNRINIRNERFGENKLWLTAKQGR